jgi:hypothetical protein
MKKLTYLNAGCVAQRWRFFYCVFGATADEVLQ